LGKQALISIVIGAAAGMQAGLLGVGGGIILVPLLVGVLRLGQHQAHGTSIAVIIFIGLPAAITYALKGHMDWILVLELAAGSMVGVVLGAKLMMRVPARELRWLFATLMVAIGIIMTIGI